MAKKQATRYSDKELEEFKTIILQKLEKAKRELEYMRNQIIELNENGNEQQRGDWVDDSSVHAEVEMLNNMVARQIQFTRNLQNALIRIQNKTYGICSMTGKLIDKERLRLVPHATKSVIGKNREKMRQRPYSHLSRVAKAPKRISPSASRSKNKTKVKKKSSPIADKINLEDLEVPQSIPKDLINMEDFKDEDMEIS